MTGKLAAFAAEIWGTLGAMAPYLLFGFLVAGLLSVLISPETVKRRLGSRGLVSVLKAAVFGVPLPLCSCGVIPVAASLRRHGASRGATTAFLLSTPQTGVDSILVTFSLLGPVFAVFRPLVALASGVAGGSIVDVIEGTDGSAGGSPMRCEGECCSPGEGGGRLGRVLRYGFVTLPRDIGKALLVGIVIAGVISAAVPGDFFADHLGGGTFGMQLVSMLVMMAVGLPVYVCATASVPVAAALILKGVSPGAALVFLMTGPATNAATIATVWKTMGRRTAITYLTTVATTALGAGLLLNVVMARVDPELESIRHASGVMLPAWLRSVAAVGLLGTLGWALVGPLLKGKPAPSLDGRGRMVTLAVKGMTCSHCVANVERALGDCAGVEQVSVDLNSGRAAVAGASADEAELKRKVEEAGYEVTDIEVQGESVQRRGQ